MHTCHAYTARGVGSSGRRTSPLHSATWQHTPVGDAGIGALAASLRPRPCPFASLSHLGLDASKCSDEGAEKIAEALAAHPRLGTLSLAGNSIRCRGAAAIAKFLVSPASAPPRLETLGLARNSIGDKGANLLAAALSERPYSVLTPRSLEHLSLNANPIGASARSALRAAWGGDEVGGLYV